MNQKKKKNKIILCSIIAALLLLAGGIATPLVLDYVESSNQEQISGEIQVADEESLRNALAAKGECTIIVTEDIVVSKEKVIEQAEGFGHSIDRQYGFLFAHSLLDLAGYDHMDEVERENMELKQDEILTRLGITR